jgi:hypothetical protein
MHQCVQFSGELSDSTVCPVACKVWSWTQASDVSTVVEEGHAADDVVEDAAAVALEYVDDATAEVKADSVVEYDDGGAEVIEEPAALGRVDGTVKSVGTADEEDVAAARTVVVGQPIEVVAIEDEVGAVSPGSKVDVTVTTARLRVRSPHTAAAV